MQEEHPLRRAIATARAGHELTARNMFLDIVKTEPHNEAAWMWLTGLFEDVDDCIHACEKTLEINPNNAQARQYLNQLLERKKQETREGMFRAEEQARAAREAFPSSTRDASLNLIRDLTNQKYVAADSWRMLAELSPEIDERVRALEKYLEIVPDDENAKSEWQQFKKFRENPLDLAMRYEEEGNIDRAISAYKLAMRNPGIQPRWDEIYRKILSLESLQQEKIRHISPVVSIIRLSAGPPLLYLSLLMIQTGINPFASPEPLLWIGLFWVLLGGAMLALASVRSHNRLWTIVFKNPDGSPTGASRMMMAAAGWLLVILPHMILFLLAFFRLLNTLQSIAESQ